jgi:Ni2+-binding GTPase involved in maturation of urease and hydrogenase
MTTPTIQDALSELLDALGFAAMAADVITETDQERLRKYARIIVKQSPQSHKLALANRFRMCKPPLM